MMDHTFNWETVVHETNINYQTLTYAVSHSHHFHSLHFTFPQEGDLLRMLPSSQITFCTFDIMYIHEVDNFQVYINILNNQHSYVNTIQQDLLPVSLLIPKYIQSVPNHKVLTALFDSRWRNYFVNSRTCFITRHGSIDWTYAKLHNFRPVFKNSSYLRFF